MVNAGGFGGFAVNVITISYVTVSCCYPSPIAKVHTFKDGRLMACQTKPESIAFRLQFTHTNDKRHSYNPDYHEVNVNKSGFMRQYELIGSLHQPRTKYRVLINSDSSSLTCVSMSISCCIVYVYSNVCRVRHLPC